MKRRACIEWLGHNDIKITNYCHQKTFNLPELKKKTQGVDLITLKTTMADETPDFELTIGEGDGKLGTPFNLFIIARIEKDRRGIIEDALSIYQGKEKVVEVTIPD